ncbi:MAG TPA: hypothetical protein PLN48_09185 [Lachnospiraceae bacterium]|nr:hypothetical protein [Lachnospiraceae bacterium]
MELIDTDNITTFPHELFSVINIYKNQLTALCNKLHFDEPYKIQHGIEPVDEQRDLVEKISRIAISILKNYQITCWHSTRLLNIADVRKNGLLISNDNGRVTRLRSIMEKLDFDEIEITSLLNKCQLYWDRDPNRQGTVHFFSSRSLFDSYDHFANNIGGEVIRYSLGKNLENSPYNKLKDNGTPVFIKFKINFSDIASMCQEKIARGFCISIIIQIILNRTCQPQFDGWTKIDIPSKNILEIKKIEGFNYEWTGFDYGKIYIL